MQLVINLKIQQEIEFEKFTKDYDYEDISNTNYLDNPLSSNNEKSPLMNLNLKLVNPDEIYNNMIDKGKDLLDDSLELKKDYEKYNDNRELRISEITKETD